MGGGHCCYGHQGVGGSALLRHWRTRILAVANLQSDVAWNPGN